MKHVRRVPTKTVLDVEKINFKQVLEVFFFRHFQPKDENYEQSLNEQSMVLSSIP